MGILRTLFKVLAGITLACLTAALVQVLYVSTPVQLAAASTSDFQAQAGNTLSLVLKAATHFAIFSLPFALIAAGIAEWLGARSLAYWLTIGVGIALLGFFAQYSSEVPGQLTIMNNYALQSFLTAGFFGGLVYWLVAGGRTASPMDQEETGSIRPRIKVEEEPHEVKKGSLAERIALRREKDAKEKAPATAANNKTPGPASEPVSRTATPAATTSVPITKNSPAATPHVPGTPDRSAPSVPSRSATETPANKA
jgi:hypothetical protein